MSLLTQTREAFAAMQGAAAEAVVTVAYDGATASGLLDTTSRAAAADLFGEAGVDVGTVRVSGADLAVPPRGATIKVYPSAATPTNAHDRQVTDTRTDSLGAILTIDYQDVREVSGI